MALRATGEENGQEEGVRWNQKEYEGKAKAIYLAVARPRKTGTSLKAKERRGMVN